MQRHSFVVFLAAFALGAVLTCAQAAPSTLAGWWSGSGIAQYRRRTYPVQCRVRFSPSAGDYVSVTAICTQGNTRYEETGRVVRSHGNSYSGSVYDTQFNERGSVFLIVRGNRLSVTVNSPRGQARLTLSRR
jgi:hypothetical protein